MVLKWLLTRCLIITAVLIIASSAYSKSGSTSIGPLKVCPDNPRYFMRPDGKAIVLAGSHTWSVLQDMGREDPPHRFDFDAYLTWISKYGHNFIRGWRFEFGNIQPDGEPYTFWVAPQPWARTGPGLALDGKPKYNLEAFDQTYFKMLRSRLIAARKKGIYMSVMFFCGWGTSMSSIGWKSHPFNSANNVNRINGDPNGNGLGGETHTLLIPEVKKIQEAYIRKTIDTVNGLDNVLYEVSNETPAEIEGSSSTDWQYYIIRFIKDYEKKKPKQHPVGMTYQYSSSGANPNLFASPADWVSPNPDGGYTDNPPVNDGKKVILSDTDHLWGMGGNSQWVWKSFMRGLNPLFMDNYDGVVLNEPFEPKYEPIRKSMGYILSYSRCVNMRKMVPHSELASSTYCLSNPGSEYLVYLPNGGEVTVNLPPIKSKVTIEWFNPNTGETKPEPARATSDINKFSSPFEGADALLFLKLDKSKA